eukprot:jgi/Tetstr1/452526/TSEL_039562.t1
MSFREKNAWIAVLTTLVIWTVYFWQVGNAALSGTLDGDAIFWLFVWCLGISIAIMLPINIVAAILARQNMDAPPDEREREIDARANRAGLILLEILMVGMVLSSGFITDFARRAYEADPAGATAIILINLTLFALAFSALIRRLRFEHNEMTQQELADRIGMTRQTVASIEHNKYSPSLEAAFRIAETFGVPIGEVFFWKAEEPRK